MFFDFWTMFIKAIQDPTETPALSPSSPEPSFVPPLITNANASPRR